MAQLRYRTERQRVSERGTWARSREQTSGGGARTSSHNNALCLQWGADWRRTERRASLWALSFRPFAIPPINGATGLPGGNSTCRGTTVEEMVNLNQTDLGEGEIVSV